MSEHDADAVVERIAKVMGQGWGAVIDTLALLKPGDDLGNGLVAVPREPTEAMLDDGTDAYHEAARAARASVEADNARLAAAGKSFRRPDGMASIQWLPQVYRAMIAAASEPTTREPNADER